MILTSGSSSMPETRVYLVLNVFNEPEHIVKARSADG